MAAYWQLSTELRPCPFCGGKAVHIDEVSVTGWLRYIGCRGCNAVVSFETSTRDGAAKMWNQRESERNGNWV